MLPSSDPAQALSSTWWQKLFIGLLTLFSATLLISRDLNNGCFFLLVLLSLGVIVFGKHGYTFRIFLKQHWLLHLGFAAMLLVELGSQLISADQQLRYCDLPARFFAFPLLAFVFMTLPQKSFLCLRAGLIVAALLNLAVFCVMTDWGALRENHTFRGLTVITFGDMALLIGVLPLAFLRCGGGRWLTALSWLAFIAGLVVSILYQSRGGWLALPFLFWLLYRQYCKEPGIRVKALVALCGAAVIAGLLALPIVQTRLAEAKTDIQMYMNGSERDTSLGLRLQMWEMTWYLLRQKPLTGAGSGVGPHEVPEFLALVDADRISMESLTKSHMHSDVLQQIVAHGLPGFIAVLLLYLAPGFFCYRWRPANDAEKALRTFGLLLATGYFIFGLSEPMFIREMLVNIYVVSFAVIIASLLQRSPEK